MVTDHKHAHGAGTNTPTRALAIACALTSLVMILQFFGGWWANSLALISDAGHMMTDAAALAIALLAIRLSKMPATKRFTFGFHRFEIFAAALNALMLFGVAAYIGYEAWGRFKNPPTSDTVLTLAIATVGLVVNFISMRLLKESSSANLNMKGAYLEVWSDMIGSIGVIVSASVAYFTGWKWLDPVIAILIALFVLPRAWALLKESMSVLLEATPLDLDTSKISEAMQSVAGITDVHELHVWTVTSGKLAVSAHAVVLDVPSHRRALGEVVDLLKNKFDISHVCVQLEYEACKDGHCAFNAQASPAMEPVVSKTARQNSYSHVGHNHV